MKLRKNGNVKEMIGMIEEILNDKKTRITADTEASLENWLEIYEVKNQYQNLDLISFIDELIEMAVSNYSNHVSVRRPVKGRIKSQGLTLQDLKNFEAEANGNGYLFHETRNKKVDQLITETANERGWSKEALFKFCDSKLGRYLGDEIIFFDGYAPKIKGMVVTYMDKFEEDNSSEKPKN